MDKTIFSDTRARIERYVASNRLKDAFETVATLAAGLSNRKIGNEIAAAEQSYHYMLDYAMQGADDPGRAEMARDLAPASSPSPTASNANTSAATPPLYTTPPSATKLRSNRTRFHRCSRPTARPRPKGRCSTSW